MIDAINQARQSIDSFLQAFFDPKPSQKNFLLKVVFEDVDRREHVWLADLDMVSNPPTGVVANEPRTSRLQFMSRVEFSAKNITDWMYLEYGFLVGGFTTRLLQARNVPAQKNGLKRIFPWRRAN